MVLILEFRAARRANGGLVNAVILRAFFFHPLPNIRDAVAVWLDKKKNKIAERFVVNRTPTSVLPQHIFQWKMTPTGSLFFTTTVQVATALGRQFADQPPKVELAAGVAVRMTVAPMAKFAEQPLPEVQSMPGGSLTIVPYPKPASKTVKVRDAAPSVSSC
jgi:hypothetical protein